jgi:hypothetical protein
MPLLTVYTSAPLLPDDKAQALLKKLSSAATEILAKPESYFMTCLVRAPMTFGGSTEPACAVEVKSIGGLAGDRVKRLSETVCRLVHEGTGVAMDRIFLVCSDVPAALWGFNGSTFG